VDLNNISERIVKPWWMFRVSEMKISVSSWSLHRELPHFLRRELAAKITITDFPRICVEEFGVEAVELCQMHFLSTDKEYLADVKRALKDWSLSLVNIPVDIGSAAEPNPEKRRAEFKVIREWFHIARYLGSPSIRVNTGGGEGEAALKRAIEGYRDLVRTAEETGVMLLIENHGGISADPDNIIKIIEEVGSNYIGTCPDFGNFPPNIRYEGLKKIAKYAPIVHAKTYDFDEKGEETRIDYKRCIDILKSQGFNGYYSIEYEGKGDQREGVKKSLKLLKRYLQ